MAILRHASISAAFILALGLFFNVNEGVKAQFSNATCATEFEWMENDLGQSPCIVASYLQGACGSNNWTVPELPRTADGARQAYNPPSPNECTCSIAVYNLLSACGACQDGDWYNYAPWSLSCVDADLVTFDNYWPEDRIPVPGDTEIPFWAQKDPRTWNGGKFDVDEAQVLDAQGPSSSTTEPPSSDTESETSSTRSSETSTQTTPPASSGGGGGSDNTGAIVGGAVGGTLGLALIGVLAWYLLRRKTKSDPTDPAAPQMTNGTPQPPPMLASIVAPVPVRPFNHRSSPSNMTTTTETSSGYGTSMQVVENARSVLDQGGHSMVPAPAPWQNNSQQSSTSLLSRMLSGRSGSSTMSNIGLLQPQVHTPHPYGQAQSPPLAQSPQPQPLVPQPIDPAAVAQPFVIPPGPQPLSSKVQRINPPTYTPSPPHTVNSNLPSDQATLASRDAEELNRLLSASPAPLISPPAYFPQDRDESRSVAPSSAVLPTTPYGDSALPQLPVPPLPPVPETEYPREKM